MSDRTIEGRGGLTRRRALGLAGLAGAAYVASPLRPFGGDTAADPEVAAAAATCVLAPEVTEGPYWVDERLNRSDVTGGQSGVPLSTQIFFSESDSAAVLATGPYSARSGRDTTNASDMIYRQEETAGNVLMPMLSGSPAAGYSGTVGIGLSGLPAGTSGSGSGSGSGGGSSSSGTDGKVEAKLLSRRFVRSGGRRDLELKVDASERVAVRAQLMRGAKSVAHKDIAAMKGAKTIAVPLGDGVAAGPARLKLALTDRVGNVRTVRRAVRIPAP